MATRKKMGAMSTGEVILVAGVIGLGAYLLFKPKTTTTTTVTYPPPVSSGNSSSSTATAAIAAGSSILTSIFDNIFNQTYY